MRLDARHGDFYWFVFDVKRCRKVRECVWCDDQTAEWGSLRRPIDLAPDGSLATDTHREERITIYPEKRTVLFNEVDDPVQEPSQVQEQAPCNAG